MGQRFTFSQRLVRALRQEPGPQFLPWTWEIEISNPHFPQQIDTLSAHPETPSVPTAPQNFIFPWQVEELHWKRLSLISPFLLTKQLLPCPLLKTHSCNKRGDSDSCPSEELVPGCLAPGWKTCLVTGGVADVTSSSGGVFIRRKKEKKLHSFPEERL